MQLNKPLQTENLLFILDRRVV